MDNEMIVLLLDMLPKGMNYYQTSNCGNIFYFWHHGIFIMHYIFSVYLFLIKADPCGPYVEIVYML